METVEIRLATEAEARQCPAIEKAAGDMFADHHPSIVEDVEASPDRFLEACRLGALLVAVTAQGRVLGHAMLAREEDAAHLAEFDVHPDAQRRGLGARLLGAVEDWGRARGAERIVLTTFRDVPWNQPYYERRGFHEIPLQTAPAAVRREAEELVAEGFGPEVRLAMERRIEKKP